MIAALLATVLLLAQPAPTATPGSPAMVTDFEIPTGPVRVEAAHLEVRKGRIVEAWGGVTIAAPGLSIRAEKVTYDRSTGKIDVIGGVRLVLAAGGEEATLQAESATIDVKTKAGVIRDATIQGAGITLHGKRISRTESGTFRIDEARFTPCACPGKPSWEITATRISARTSGLAILQGGVLRAKGVPIFFLPLGFAPFSSERASGLLSPQLSTGGAHGTVATLPFYLAVSPRWDITVEPGIFEKRGAYASIGGRLAHPRGRSEATLFYHADRKIKGDAEALTRNPDDYSTNRWYATARVTEDFGRGYVGKARIDLAGDDRYNFDYGPSILERSRPEYENNIFVERRDGIIGLIAGTTYYQDLRIVGSTGIDGPAPYNSAQTVSRAASIDVSAGGLPLLGRSGLGVAADLGGEYEFFNNMSSPQGSFRRGGELSGAPRRQVQHVQFRPAFSTPISLAGDGIRLTALGGAMADASADPLGDDPRMRLAPFVGADARAEWRRTFGAQADEEGVKFQHRVGPVGRWTWIPDVLGDDLTSFESPVNTPVEGHRIEAGFSNRLLFRRDRTMPVRELIEVLLLERFRPEGPDGGETVLNLDLRTGPLRFDLDTAVKNQDGGVSSAGGRIATRAGEPEGLSLEYAYAPERDSHQGTAGGWLKLAELTRSGKSGLARALQTLTLQAGARYDFNGLALNGSEGRFVAVSGGLSYESPCGCWGLRLGASQEADRERYELGRKRDPVTNKKEGGVTFPITDFLFSIDLHPPNAVRRFTSAPGGS